MALRRRGKNNFYHAYFRTVIAGPDGTLKYATATVKRFCRTAKENHKFAD